MVKLRNFLLLLVLTAAGFCSISSRLPPLPFSSNFPRVIKANCSHSIQIHSCLSNFHFKKTYLMEKSTWSNLLQLLLSCHQGDTERRTSLALQEGGKAGGELKWEMEGNRQREDEKSPLCLYGHIRVHNTYMHVCVHINTDLDAHQTSWVRVYLFLLLAETLSSFA